MKKVAIIQARMGSSRLFGKVLADVCGYPMLYHQVNRLLRCEMLDEIVIATTDDPVDDPLHTLAGVMDIRCVRGSETDVLGRYYKTACESQADVIVRVTADCPLVDPEVTDTVIRSLVSNTASYDYVSNVAVRTYPRGLDVEAFFADVLERLVRTTVLPSQREHVTGLIHQNTGLYATHCVRDFRGDNSDLRWTVDTVEDYWMIAMLYEVMELDRQFRGYPELLEYVRAHPRLATHNQHVKQKAS